MNRLTTKDGEIAGCNHKTCGAICNSTTFCCDCPIGEAFRKLKEYEDTGLEPEEIRRLCDGTCV